MNASRPEMIAANAELLQGQMQNGKFTDVSTNTVAGASLELHYLTRMFMERGWRCYWWVLDEVDVDGLNLHNVYDVTNATFIDLPRDILNTNVDAILVKMVGSVEAKFALMKRYFETLQSDFAGVVVNDPASAIYGMRKDYLFELSAAGFNTIPTDYYDTSVQHTTLANQHAGVMSDYIIKPVTGEKSNSFSRLDNISEEWLRRKEPLVGGWLVQPMAPEVWNGEYQILYLGDNNIHAQKKAYPRSAAEAVPSQSDRLISDYVPTTAEVNLGLDVIALWRERMGLSTDLLRLDFLKDANDTPIILEVETVNPGFFPGNFSEERRLGIAGAFVQYIADKSAKKVAL